MSDSPTTMVERTETPRITADVERTAEGLFAPSHGWASFSRVWAMPSADTFSVLPIGAMVQRYLKASKTSCDPFARNKRWATHTNDLNPKTEAEHHMDAEVFLRMLAAQGVRCDLAILDPPYSPRQISECYQEAGIKCGMKETQNTALYSRVKNAMAEVLTDNAIVLSFGWNSAGMGQKHGFEQIEIMLVCHGGAHNDTICLAERKRPNLQGALL
jgi:Predicted SAM-dependent methyltransferases